MNAPAPIAEGEPLRDVAWWAVEAERNGTDWESLLLAVVRELGFVPCPICERMPCETPSFCELCRKADARLRRPKWGGRQ